MNTIIVSGKGGVGKSTLACGLAHQWGHDLIDADGQLSAFHWWTTRQGLALERPRLQQSQLAAVPMLLRSDASQVIDTPGAMVGGLQRAIAAADRIVVVTGDHRQELDALPDTLDLCRLANRPMAVVLNRVHHSTDAAEALELIGSAGFTVCPVVVRERAAHHRAWAESLTAAELEPDGAAAREIQELADWLEANL